MIDGKELGPLNGCWDCTGIYRDPGVPKLGAPFWGSLCERSSYVGSILGSPYVYGNCYVRMLRHRHGMNRARLVVPLAMSGE